MRLFHGANNADIDRYAKHPDPEGAALVREIARTRQEIEDAYNHFQNASDPDLIDCYTYEIYSVQKRYKFLLEQAKQMDLQTYF